VKSPPCFETLRTKGKIINDFSTSRSPEPVEVNGSFSAQTATDIHPTTGLRNLTFAWVSPNLDL
jgi:hypothetical protein